MKMIAALFTILFSMTALANPMACFEREWIIAKGPSTPANITLAQVEQMIRARVPALVVKSSNKSLLVVEYRPMKSIPDDKIFLDQTFNYLIKTSGLIVECNNVVIPQPSMTGRNFR